MKTTQSKPTPSIHTPSKTKPLPKSNIYPHGLIVGQGKFQYRVNCEWGMQDSEKYPVENCHDLAMDSQGRIFLVTDHPKNNVLIYSRTGELLDAWGSMFPGAHSIRIVNENGEEVIYLVDSGWITNRKWDGVSTDAWDSPTNKVIAQSGFIAKLTLDGRLIFTIGHPQTIGVYTPDQPFRPTDIAVAPNGDLYVTDGYGSDYVLHYSSNGQFIRRWGGANNANAECNLVNIHGIEVDFRNPNDPHLIVSSRVECKLKQFNLDGTYRGTIDTAGAHIGGPVFSGDHFFAPVCWSNINGKTVDNSGFISVFDKNNQVVANIGGTAPNYQGGQLQPMCSSWDVFNHCHGLCIDENGVVYVGQWRANQTYPIRLEPV